MGSDQFVVNVEVGLVDPAAGTCLLIRRCDREEHAAGLLSLPGGKIDASDMGENIIEIAARREVEEEVGVVPGALRFVYSSGFSLPDGRHVINIVLATEQWTGTPKVVATDEVSAIIPVELSRRESPSLPPWTQRSLDLIAAMFR